MRYKLSYSPKFRAEIINLVGDTRLILGSNSPRRAEILEMLGLKFEKIIPDINEDICDIDKPPEYAEYLAEKKALAVRAEGQGMIIAADTIVVLGSEIINKPENEVHAMEMLTGLSGQTHSVITAVALSKMGSEKAVCDHSESRVKFHKLTHTIIKQYIESGEPFGKAGAYAIQGSGGELVESYDGALDNIIGFPAVLFAELFKRVKSEV